MSRGDGIPPLISEITLLPSGQYIVDLLNPDGSSARVAIFKTWRGASRVADKWMRAWPGTVGLTCGYWDTELPGPSSQRCYGRMP